MSLDFFEALERIESVPVRKRLVDVFSNNYTFAKLVQIISRRDRFNTNFSTIIDMFNYFDISVSYGEDLFELSKKLKMVDVNRVIVGEKYRRTREPEVSPDKNLLFLLSTVDHQNKHRKYKFLKRLLEQCNKTEFKWVMKIICSPAKVRWIICR